MHLNSQNGPICVLLVNHDMKSDSPVVVPVPPPEEGAVPTNISDNTNSKVQEALNENTKSTSVIKEETIEDRLHSKCLIFCCFHSKEPISDILLKS